MMHRALPLFLAILLLCPGCKGEKRYHDEISPGPGAGAGEIAAEVLAFQQELNESFRDPETSPLPDRLRKDFEGLDFFEPDSLYRVRALLERTPEAVPFLMPTTTERKATEKLYGIAKFSIKGVAYALEIYQSPELQEEEGFEDYLFLPFLDDTNGQSTYAGGRYIDLRVPQGDTLIIDFNRAYNPYCAYNKKYSCPIVPRVNYIAAEIRAGVKAFKTP